MQGIRILWPCSYTSATRRSPLRSRPPATEPTAAATSGSRRERPTASHQLVTDVGRLTFRMEHQAHHNQERHEQDRLRVRAPEENTTRVITPIAMTLHDVRAPPGAARRPPPASHQFMTCAASRARLSQQRSARARSTSLAGLITTLLDRQIRSGICANETF